MAAGFVATRATATNKVSGAANLAPSITAAAGDLVVLALGMDNQGSTGPSITSIAVPAGETATWRFAGDFLPTGSTNLASVKGEIYVIKTTQAWTAHAATITLGVATTAKAVVVREFSGVDPLIRCWGAGSINNGTPTATTTGPTPQAGDLAIGLGVWEDTTVPTADADTSGGSWDAGSTTSTTGSTADTNVAVIMQHKILTGSGHQTYNPTGTAVDAGAVCLVLIPTPAAVPFSGTTKVLSATSSSGTTTLTKTLTAAPTDPANDLTVVFIRSSSGAALDAAGPPISDSRNGTAGWDYREATNTTLGRAHVAFRFGGGLQIGDTITIKVTAGTSLRAEVWAVNVAGGTITAVDTWGEASDATGSATGVNAPATLTTTNPDGVVVSCVTSNAATDRRLCDNGFTIADLGGNALGAGVKFVDTAADHRAGWDWSRAQPSQTSAVSIAFGITRQVAAGQATETDTAQAVARLKARAAGEALETDTAGVVRPLRLRPVGQATEASTAQPVTRGGQAIPVGQALETSTAQPVGRVKARAAGEALETDTAGVVRPVRLRPAGQAVEADTAGQTTARKALTAAQATETDLAQGVGQVKRQTAAQALETDLAQPIAAHKALPAGQATEVDTAQTVGWRKAEPVGMAVEVDTAGQTTARKTLTAAQAVETDLAQGVGQVKRQTAAQALEVDTAGAVRAVRLVPVGMATEADTAGQVTAAKALTVSTALETDTAGVVRPVRLRPAGQAVEADTAGQTTARKALQAAQATETDLARGVGQVKRQTAAQALEADTAGQVTRGGHSVTAGQALEVDTAQPVGWRKAEPTGQAVEVDTAQPVAVHRIRRIPVGMATETSTAQPTRRVKARLVGQVLEVDTATGLATRRGYPARQAVEVDTPQPVDAHRRRYVPTGQAVEVDVARVVDAVGGHPAVTLGGSDSAAVVTAVVSSSPRGAGPSAGGRSAPGHNPAGGAALTVTGAGRAAGIEGG